MLSFIGWFLKLPARGESWSSSPPSHACGGLLARRCGCGPSARRSCPCRSVQGTPSPPDEHTARVGSHCRCHPDSDQAAPHPASIGGESGMARLLCHRRRSGRAHPTRAAGLHQAGVRSAEPQQRYTSYTPTVLRFARFTSQVVVHGHTQRPQRLVFELPHTLDAESHRSRHAFERVPLAADAVPQPDDTLAANIEPRVADDRLDASRRFHLRVVVGAVLRCVGCVDARRNVLAVGAIGTQPTQHAVGDAPMSVGAEHRLLVGRVGVDRLSQSHHALAHAVVAKVPGHHSLDDLVNQTHVLPGERFACRRVGGDGGDQLFVGEGVCHAVSIAPIVGGSTPWHTNLNKSCRLLCNPNKPRTRARHRVCRNGGRGIRTPERPWPLLDFKSSAFNRSAIPPDHHQPASSRSRTISRIVCSCSLVGSVTST